MDRLAVFVDAGYFFAAGGNAAFGVTQRHLLHFPRPGQCVAEIIARASEMSDNENLLRVYWYDALTGVTPTATQSTLAHLHGVKLRLGVLNQTGEQKGVDSLIVTDLIDLARNRAIADAVLVSGDEDLRIAVQVAQSYGVRVHILAAGEPNHSVSLALQMEADSVHHLDGEWFKKHFVATIAAERPIPREDRTPVADFNVFDAAEKAIDEVLAGIGSEGIAMLAELFSKSRGIPSEYDGKLIACTAKYAKRKRLNGDEMRQIRGVFVRRIRGLNDSAES